MSYNYQAERAKLFTEEGVVLLTAVRDQVKELLKHSGAFRQDHISPKGIGAWDSWTLMACIDYLLEKKEIVEIPRQCWSQYKVYSTPEVHNR